jgi:hypothetical protein
MMYKGRSIVANDLMVVQNDIGSKNIKEQDSATSKSTLEEYLRKRREESAPNLESSEKSSSNLEYSGLEKSPPKNMWGKQKSDNLWSKLFGKKKGK